MSLPSLYISPDWEEEESIWWKPDSEQYKQAFEDEIARRVAVSLTIPMLCCCENTGRRKIVGLLLRSWLSRV